VTSVNRLYLGFKLQWKKSVFDITSHFYFSGSERLCFLFCHRRNFLSAWSSSICRRSALRNPVCSSPLARADFSIRCVIFSPAPLPWFCLTPNFASQQFCSSGSVPRWWPLEHVCRSFPAQPAGFRLCAGSAKRCFSAWYDFRCRVVGLAPLLSSVVCAGVRSFPAICSCRKSFYSAGKIFPEPIQALVFSSFLRSGGLHSPRSIFWFLSLLWAEQAKAVLTRFRFFLLSLITDCEDNYRWKSILFSDQKAQCFFISISLKRLLPKHAH
jgi:hypothetical protein